MKYGVLLVCIAAAAGCAQGHPAPDTSLTNPVVVDNNGVRGQMIESSVTFTIEGGFASPSEVSMNVTTPVLELHTTDRYAEIDALTLPLGDVKIPAEALPPKGLTLRNLVVKTGATRAAIVHAQDDALELRAKLPLSLDWSVQLDDGSLYPLGTVKTEPINVDVQIVRSGGSTVATVQAACLGTCWAVDGVAKLSNGAVYLQSDVELTWPK